MKENIYITRNGERQINAVTEYNRLTAPTKHLYPISVPQGEDRRMKCP
jgi:hypothetical protein